MGFLSLRTLGVVVRAIDEHLCIVAEALRDQALTADGRFFRIIAQASAVDVGEGRTAGGFTLSAMGMFAMPGQVTSLM